MYKNMDFKEGKNKKAGSKDYLTSCYNIVSIQTYYIVCRWLCSMVSVPWQCKMVFYLQTPIIILFKFILFVPPNLNSSTG